MIWLVTLFWAFLYPWDHEMYINFMGHMEKLWGCDTSGMHLLYIATYRFTDSTAPLTLSCFLFKHHAP